MDGRRMGTRLVTGMFITCCVLAFGSIPAAAGVVEETPRPVRKLGRGLANTVTGVLEVPKAVQSISKSDGPAVGLSVGLLRGIGFALARTGTGVLDVVTFPFPLGRVGYDSLIQPEFMTEPDRLGGPQS